MKEMIGSNGNKLSIAVGERLAIVCIEAPDRPFHPRFCVHTELDKLQSLLLDVVAEETDERRKEEKEIDETDRKAYEQYKRDAIRGLR